VDPGDYNLTISSLYSLSKYNTDSAIQGIKKGMGVSHEEMREVGNRSTAISSAGSVRLAAAHAPLLMSMRKDNYWPVRLTVVQALSRLGTPEAITILQEMSKDGNEDVSREANIYLSSKEKN
jgi:HEAT repeat protein